MRRELSSQWQDLGEFIRGQREITQLSLRRLAELADVSAMVSASRMPARTYRLSAEICSALAICWRISADGRRNPRSIWLR